MFSIDFPEIVIIFGVALVVLGPKKLPGTAAQIGRWVGRARAMARQFREQLEQEVSSVEGALDTRRTTAPAKGEVTPTEQSSTAAPAGGTVDDAPVPHSVPGTPDAPDLAEARGLASAPGVSEVPTQPAAPSYLQPEVAGAAEAAPAPAAEVPPAAMPSTAVPSAAAEPPEAQAPLAPPGRAPGPWAPPHSPPQVEAEPVPDVPMQPVHSAPEVPWEPTPPPAPEAPSEAPSEARSEAPAQAPREPAATEHESR